eukprot:g15318.t1
MFGGGPMEGTDFQASSPTSHKRAQKRINEANAAAEDEEEWFGELIKKAKMPKGFAFSPVTKERIKGLADMDAPVATALQSESIAELIEEKRNFDPLTGKLKRMAHYDAIMKGACTDAFSSAQQIDCDETIERALDIPANLTDPALIQARIRNSMTYVGRYQELQSVGTYSTSAKAVCAELHSKYAAKVIKQQFSEEHKRLQNIGQSLTLKWVGEWVSANESYVSPFLLIDESRENENEMNTETMHDWMLRFLDRHQELPITAFKDLKETLEDADQGFEGLIMSKRRLLQAMKPACELAANVGRLTQVRDRMVMKSAVHADTTFGICRAQEMPSPSPMKDDNNVPQSPTPLAGFSPVAQPDSEIRPRAHPDIIPEHSEQMDAEEPEEVDPTELVPATAQLVCETYLTHYLKSYPVGFIRWASKDSLKKLMEKNDLEYEQKVGLSQISTELVKVVNCMKSFQYPSGIFFDAAFDLGTYAAQTIVFNGSVALGLSAQANGVFTKEFTSIPFSVDKIMRRLVERMDHVKTASNPVDRKNQHEKLCEFKPWIEWAGSILLAEVSAFLPNENSDQFWKLKVIKRVAIGLKGLFEILDQFFVKKKTAAQIYKDPDCAYAMEELNVWTGPKGPDNTSFVKTMLADVVRTVIYANAFNIICEDEMKRTRDLVLAQPQMGILMMDVLEKRKKLITTNDCSHLKFLNKSWLTELAAEFEKFAAGNMNREATGAAGAPLGAGARKVKRKFY